jgi:uncharacterized RDD family membrane protein YckC
MANYSAQHTQRMNELEGIELAGFIRRWVAFFLDIIIMALLFLIFSSAIIPLLIKNGLIKSDEEIIFALNLNWYSIVWTVLYFSLATYIGNGKTPGKWITRVRVVSLVHKKMTLWHSVERALGYGASFLELGFGFFQYFIHPNRCTVHDRIAETIVIRDIHK